MVYLQAMIAAPHRVQEKAAIWPFTTCGLRFTALVFGSYDLDNSRAVELPQLLRRKVRRRTNHGLRRGRYDGVSSHFHRVGGRSRSGKWFLKFPESTGGSVERTPPTICFVLLCIPLPAVSGRSVQAPHLSLETDFDTMTTTRRRPATIIASSLFFASGLTLAQGFCFGGALCDSNARPRCRGATSAERRATQQVHVTQRI